LLAADALALLALDALALDPLVLLALDALASDALALDTIALDELACLCGVSVLALAFVSARGFVPSRAFVSGASISWLVQLSALYPDPPISLVRGVFPTTCRVSGSNWMSVCISGSVWVSSSISIQSLYLHRGGGYYYHVIDIGVGLF
jgi:hypothetical protein